MGLHKNIQQALTGRDDLRYTDQVIATLQHSAYEAWFKAVLLNVPEDDIPYHMREIEGLRANGAEPLGIADIRDYRRMAARAEKPKEPAPKAQAPKHALYVTGRVWSKNPAYYETRNIMQICADMACSRDAAYKHLKRHGYKYQKLVTVHRDKRKIDYPTDPQWYATRTLSQAATDLRIDKKRLHSYIHRHGYTFKPRPKRQRLDEAYDSNPEVYKHKTITQLEKILGYSGSAIRHFLTSRGIPFRMVRQPYANRVETMPKDADWYAVRTIEQICDALGMTQHAVRNYIRTRGLKYQLVYPKASPLPFPTSAEYYATRTMAELITELGTNQKQVRCFMRRHGFTYLKTENEYSTPDMLNFPTDPEWYAKKTVREAREILRCTDNVMRKFLDSRGWEFKRVQAPYRNYRKAGK